MIPFANDPSRSFAELERALRDVPAYERWRSLDPGPRADVDARYAALPSTTNAWIRVEGPDRFVPSTTDLAKDLAAGRVERIQTSGTTGPPTPLLFSEAWWSASERASWALHPALAAATAGEHAEVVVASSRCVGPGFSARPRPVGERTLGRVLFVNEYADVALWTEATVRQMLEEIGRHAPAVMEADPFYLAELCSRAQALSLPLPQPRVVVLTYALPSRLHLARIRRAIAAPIVSSYGSTESGYVFMSCEHGRLHQCVSSCRVDGVPARPQIAEGVSKLLVTPFANPWACFLRFDVGDIASTALACPCGRADGTIVERLHGRVKHCTLRADGRIVTPAQVDDAIASAPQAEEIVSYQLEQLDALELRLRATSVGTIDPGAIAGRLRDLYGGSSQVRVELVSNLVAEASGKYVSCRTLFAVDRDAWWL